jgi:Flp pilus assembly pilin Flp
MPDWRLTVMQALKSYLAFFKDARGVTAVEYAVIAGVVVVGIATAFTALGGKLADAINALSL